MSDSNKPKRPEIFNLGSDICYEHEESLRILKSLNSVISGLSAMGDIRYVFDLLNTPTDVQDTYQELLKLWGLDPFEISCKIEILRNLIFGDAIQWREIENTLSNYSQKCIEYGGGAE